MKKSKIAIAAITGAVLLSGCESQADTTNRNISTAAENFEIQRHIIGVNAITDSYAFEVEGRCSIERSADGKQLDAICLHSPTDQRRHSLGISDNVYWVSTQTAPANVSGFRTRIIIRPETVIPVFDLETSTDLENDG